MFLTYAVETTCFGDTGFLPLSSSFLFLFAVALAARQAGGSARTPWHAPSRLAKLHPSPRVLIAV